MYTNLDIPQKHLQLKEKSAGRGRACVGIPALRRLRVENYSEVPLTSVFVVEGKE